MHPEKGILESSIIAMIQSEAIKFKTFSNCQGLIDVEITSDVFTDKKFMISVYEDDWNSCPARTIASELADLISDGDIEFIPLAEEQCFAK